MPYKRNGKWLAQIRVKGKTKRKSFLKKKDAIEWEVKHKKQIGQLEKTEIPIICLVDWATAYLEYAEAKFVHSTWDEKRRMFRYFFKGIPGDLPADRLTSGMILNLSPRGI